MWTCRNCKEQCDDEFDACWNCGVGRDGAAPNEVFEAERVEESLETVSMNALEKGKSGSRSLVPRYADAYLTARATTGFGATVKVMGIVIGVVVAIAGAALGTESDLGGAVTVIGILAGIVTALPIYILGILITAQGQILKASLDTAVNTSPFLSKEEMRKMMSLD